jgi:hypothetical protein
MSVLATTVMHITPWTLVGADGMIRERRPATATTLVAVDATTAARTGAQALIR